MTKLIKTTLYIALFSFITVSNALGNIINRPTSLTLDQKLELQKKLARQDKQVIRWFHNHKLVYLHNPKAKHIVQWHKDHLATTLKEIAKTKAVIKEMARKRAEQRQRLLGNINAWLCIHDGQQHGPYRGNGVGEGPWNAHTGNGYYGGLQMDISFMSTYGSDMIRKYGGYAHMWSPRDQIIVAQRAFASGRGYHPWPNTARYCGLI